MEGASADAWLQRGRDHVVAEGSPGSSRNAWVCATLQRGRDHVVAEGRAMSSSTTRPGQLQRGRDHVVAEGGLRDRRGFGRGRFNGAATTWSRKVGCRGKPEHFSRRFNGAATTWSRKDIRPGWIGGRKLASFNGAATTWSRKGYLPTGGPGVKSELQRGRDHVVAEGCCPPPDMAEGVRLQRGRDHVVAEGVSHTPPSAPFSPGFNGAATTWSRKVLYSGAGTLRQVVASTGPRPRGRGRRGTGSAPRMGRLRFNGAATTWSRKEHEQYRVYTRTTSFNGAATTWSRKGGNFRIANHGYHASTGPRPRGRGRTPDGLESGAMPRLQRGRDHVVAEGAGTDGGTSALDVLQRGRDHVVAEGAGAPFKRRNREVGFNGAATTWSRKAHHAIPRRIR